MIFLSELFSTVIHEASSSFSGLIKVVDFRGERRLIIGGLVQSVSLGRSMGHRFWGRLAAYPLPKKKDLTVLILGLGGGTVAHLLSKSLKPKKIVGVEIDPIVVEVGKKYFGLERIKNLSVIIEDAKAFVKDNPEKFDYIIVDTYQGGVFPRVFEGSSFLKKLKKSLAGGGILVFNRIFLSSRPGRRLRFIKLLEETFGTVKEEIIEGPADAKNYLYWILPNPSIPSPV